MNDGQCFRIDLDEERRGAWHHMSRKVIDPRATQPVALISSEILARVREYSRTPFNLRLHGYASNITVLLDRRENHHLIDCKLI